MSIFQFWSKLTNMVWDYTYGSNQDFNTAWRPVKVVVRDVLKMQPVSRKTWTDTFEAIYTMVVSNEEFPKLAYERIQIILEAHVKECARRLERSPAGKLLNDYYDIWKSYDDAHQHLQALFSLLNSKLCSGNDETDGSNFNDGNFMDIQKLALNLWMTEVLKPDLANKIVRLLLDAIIEGRRDLLSNQKLFVMQTIIQSISRVNESMAKNDEESKFYKETFGNPFLERLKDHYRWEASKMLQELSISQYIEKVLAKLDEENKWIAIIIPNLYPTDYVKDVFIEHFIQTNSMDQILSEGVRMIEEERADDLVNFNKILKEILQREAHNNDSETTTLSPLISAFQNHVQKKAMESVVTLEGEDAHIQYFENLLLIHDKYTALIQETLEFNSLFNNALQKAFQFVSSQKLASRKSGDPAELCAKYCDTLLRMSNSSDSDMDRKIDRCQIVLQYIYEMDAFLKFYARLLAKRLLLQTSESIEREERMLTMLDKFSGFGGTDMLKKMLVDVKVSNDLNAEFDHSSLNVSKFDFSVKVLQSSAWPLPHVDVPVISLPREIECVISQFTSFYTGKFKAHKIQWHFPISKCVIKLNYLHDKQYLVSMDAYHLAVLMLFEYTDKLFFGEIKHYVPLPDKTLKLNIGALVEKQILTCDTDVIGDESQLNLNLKFSHKATRIKITNHKDRIIPEERAETNRSVDNDRNCYLQAAIIRVMKARKTLSYKDIVSEVLAQTKGKFPLHMSNFKVVIDTLVDKYYIELLPETQDVYKYIA
ncbi:Hypothetical predicted protein [Cloeon dipterum]|uniref:Cullin family profile domain-containing protein n=1 Tax=Cloeon dipterum TaxID=197152 RepID=A0A8S1BKC5_9INSE|nr:Hypothetical predicted protein [Cloeon dipterum]